MPSATLTNFYTHQVARLGNCGRGRGLITPSALACKRSAGSHSFCCEDFRPLAVRLESRGGSPPPSLPCSHRGASQHFYLPGGERNSPARPKVAVVGSGIAGLAVAHGVDTGFLVFDERTYPHLIQLFADLGVASAPSDMPFSVKRPGTGMRGALA